MTIPEDIVHEKTQFPCPGAQGLSCPVEAAVDEVM